MTDLPSPDSSTFFVGPGTDPDDQRFVLDEKDGTYRWANLGAVLDETMITQFACIICFQLYVPQDKPTADELFCSNDCRIIDRQDADAARREMLL